MNTRSRLARLETRVQSQPTLVGQSAEDMRRAEIARQRLPDCTDLEEGLGLIQGLPSEVYITLLRLVPEAMLFAMHDVAFRHYLFETLTYGYTGEELRELPVSELLRLHWDNLEQVEKHRRRYR